MNLEEAKTVVRALQDDTLIEEALEIMLTKITELEYQKRKTEAGAGLMDSIETCSACGETFVWKMAGGGECSNPDCNNVEICY